MKRKLVTFLLSFALLVGATGCGQASAPTKTSNGLDGEIVDLIVGGIAAGIIKNELDGNKKEEEKEPESTKPLDESCFDGTYLPVTTEKAKAFLGNLNNVKNIGDANWWNAYLDKNGGAKFSREWSDNSITTAYASKEEGKLAISAVTGNEIIYSDDTAIYVNVGGVKEKAVISAQADAYWMGLGVYDLFGVIGCYFDVSKLLHNHDNPSLAGRGWEWAPELRSPYKDYDFAYYMDETDSELTKIKMIITENASISSTVIFVCKNGYIVACNKVSTSTTKRAMILLPWTGTVEKPTDLDTYQEVTP